MTIRSGVGCWCVFCFCCLRLLRMGKVLFVWPKPPTKKMSQCRALIGFCADFWCTLDGRAKTRPFVFLCVEYATLIWLQKKKWSSSTYREDRVRVAIGERHLVTTMGWACQACTFVNEDDTNFSCGICNTRRGGGGSGLFKDSKSNRQKSGKSKQMTLFGQVVVDPSEKKKAEIRKEPLQRAAPIVRSGQKLAVSEYLLLISKLLLHVCRVAS